MSIGLTLILALASPQATRAAGRKQASMPGSAATSPARSQNGANPRSPADADAQFNLGQAYKLGRGVAVDLDRRRTGIAGRAAGPRPGAGQLRAAAFPERQAQGSDAVASDLRRPRRTARAVCATAPMLFQRRRWRPGLGPRLCADDARSAAGMPQASESARPDGPLHPAARPPKGHRAGAQVWDEASAARAGPAADDAVKPAAAPSRGP